MKAKHRDLSKEGEMKTHDALTILIGQIERLRLDHEEISDELERLSDDLCEIRNQVEIDNTAV